MSISISSRIVPRRDIDNGVSSLFVLFNGELRFSAHFGKTKEKKVRRGKLLRRVLRMCIAAPMWAPHVHWPPTAPARKVVRGVGWR